ncbi:MAG TPA: DoxX family protein [Candidatus Deferrimicrobiaceae bacterium]
MVGFFKISLAILLLAGIWIPSVTKPAATGIALLMLGAVSMHLKVRDPIKKSLPAFSLLVLSLVVILL